MCDLFLPATGKWQVSAGGGEYPRWRGDSQELFYMDRASDGRMMAVDVKAGGPTFEAGTPREMFDSGFVNLNHPAYHTYAVSADGQRFLIPRPVTSRAAEIVPPIAVVLNWAEGIAR